MVRSAVSLRALCAGFVSLCVIASTIAHAPIAVAVEVSPQATPSPSSYSDAAALAKSSGTPQIVASQVSQFALPSVNPDGSLSVDVSAAPVRILVDGSWQDLDLSLTQAGQQVVPTVAGDSVTFAGGGTSDPLAKVAIPSDLLSATAASFTDTDQADDPLQLGRSTSDKDPAIALGWSSGSAPTPTVNGEQATYSNIAADVDATVDADARGFDLSLVMNQAPYAPSVVTLPLQFAGGLKVSATTAPITDPISVMDSSGAQVGYIGPFTMTDSSQNPVSGEPNLVQSVPVSVVQQGDSMALQIPVQPFTAANAQYPVKISGSSGLGLSDWGRGWKGKNPTYADFRVGVLDDADRARGYVRFPVSGVGPGTVTSASLKVWKDWTGSCSNTLQVVLPNAKWKRYPANNGFPGPDVSGKKADAQTPCPQDGVKPMTMAIGANVVQPWTSKGNANWGFGFKTAHDTGSDPTIEWLRLCSPKYCNGGSRTKNIPVLSISYAPPTPADPANLDWQPRNNINGKWYSNSTNPVLSALFSVSPAPGYPGIVQGTFRTYDVTGGQPGMPVCQQVVNNIASGARGSTNACPPGQQLQNGHTYEFNVQAASVTGATSSVVAFPVPVTIDTSPPQPVNITATTTSTSGQTIEVTNGGWASAADPAKPVDFTLLNDPADELVAYQVREDGFALADIPARPGVPTHVGWGAGGGWHNLSVNALDRAGNAGTVVNFDFGIGAAALTAPGIQQRAARYFPVAASAPKATQTGVTAQVLWKPPGDNSFSVVTAGLDVVDASGGSTPWNGLVGTSADGKSMVLPDGLTWDITKIAAAHQPNPIEAPGVVQVMARFVIPGGATVDTDAVVVQWVSHEFGGNFAVSDIGPGQVSLSTGELSMSATDAALPGSSVSAGRSWLSYEGTPGNAIFGPGWVPSIPTPDSGAGEANVWIAPDFTSITLTYPDGWVDTYGLGAPPASAGKAAKAPKAGDGRTYIGTGDTAQDGGYLTLNGPTLTFTDTDGSVTTWTLNGTTWSVSQVSSTTVGDSTRTFYSAPTASADGILATVTGRFIRAQPSPHAPIFKAWTPCARHQAARSCGGRFPTPPLRNPLAPERSRATCPARGSDYGTAPGKPEPTPKFLRTHTIPTAYSIRNGTHESAPI